MAQSVYLPGLAIQDSEVLDVPRHSVLVRITHWIHAVSFIALVVSGIGILLSHPRFYWGEAGNVMTPSLFDLPIPASRTVVNTGYGFVLADQNGWSRSLHFQTAWLLLFTGAVYAAAGFLNRHFRDNLLPAIADLRPRALGNVHKFVSRSSDLDRNREPGENGRLDFR